MALEGKTLGGTTEAGGSYVELKMWVGDPNDPTKGLTIESSTVDYLCITENMFTLLPMMTLQLVDQGRFFYTYSIKIGDTINVILKPSKVDGDEDSEPKEFFKGQFMVQTIIDMPGINSQTNMHKYHCVYGAQKYINEVAPYPVMGLIANPMYYMKNKSTDALREIIEQSGLGFSDDTDRGEIDDKSLWINCNETRGQFADRVVNHAWAGLGNAPILFTDVNGIAHYLTIKDICKASGDKQRGDVDYVCTKVGLERGQKNLIMFDDAIIVNAAGPVLNQGGYSLNISMYNPYNKEKIPYKEAGMIAKVAGLDKPHIPVYTGSLFAQAGAALNALANGGFEKNDRGDGHRTNTYKNDGERLAGIKNASPSLAETITKFENGGMHFDEMHNYYTIAAAHNEQVRRSFFQQFVQLEVDSSRQKDPFKKDFTRPHLADTINIDFSNSEKIDAIHSGRYCIAQIKHIYTAKKPYTLEVTAVNDGIYGTRGS